MYRTKRNSAIHEEFARVAAIHPDRIAVSDGANRLTYAQLESRASGAANAMRARAVTGEKVGLVAGRTVDMVVGILAILKTGSAYVPLDPTYPADRLRFVAEDAELKAILVADGCAVPDLGDQDALVIHLGETHGYPETDTEPVQVAGSDLAYVIYTSGSTGTPKGVMVEHRHVLGLFDGADEHFEFGPKDAWTVVHSYAFDFSVWEIFGALLYGGRAVIVPRETMNSPEETWRLIQREQVTILNATPTYFARLDEADDGYGHRLRHVIFGGEALELSRLASWCGRYGDAGPQLVNMYGITETTVHVTVRPLTVADTRQSKSLVGKPLPHLTIRLLDESLQPVRPGEIGEICVGGVSVARGYLGRDELTAQRFVPDPLGDPQDRLYRSGDLGRLTEDGDLEYLGRSDDQLKIRGFRIEPAEIQHCLREHESVRDVAVVAREGQHVGSQLIAYVVASGGTLEREALQRHVAERLPAYMVPGLYVSVPELPLTANGKLDRSALPAPGALDAAAAPVQLSPVGGQLLTIWREVLEMRDLGAEDTFYSVGGDSIQAIRIVGAAKEQGISFSVEHLLEYRTVAGLAAFVEAGSADTPPQESAELHELITAEDRSALPAGVADAFPMTSLQLGMLFHSEGADRSTYHSVSSAVVHTAFDEALMRRHLEDLTTIHEAMRTSFDLETFSQPMQIIHDSVKPRLTTADLVGWPQALQEEWVAQRLAEEQVTPIDWRLAPLVRFRVDVLTADSFRLTWTEHHALLDGWSSNSLMAELIERYTGHGVAQKPNGAVPSLRDFVLLERQALSSSSSFAFWQSRLGDVPACTLPPAQNGERQTFDVRLLSMVKGAFAKLDEAARARHTTPRALLLAAYAIALGRHLGTDIVVAGLVVHGRPEHPRADEMLGLFLNTVPMPVRLHGSLSEIASSVSDFERAVHPHRHYPLAAIQRAARAGFELDNMLSFTDFHRLEQLVRGGAIDGASLENRVRTHYPLVVETERPAGSDELTVSVQFRADRWPAPERQAFLEILHQTLSAAIVAPESLRVEKSQAAEVIDGVVADAPPPIGSAPRLIGTGASHAQATPLVGDWDQLVAELWESVLGVCPRSRETVFSDIGGDSLSLMRLVGRYARQGFALKVADLLENDTVAAQAGLLEAHVSGGGR